ncbi:MFS transporter [Corynebacterium pygosceleis]|uniref:MFS transporter n=1 Tax=Corynebacterium pygosceleis TaxID=2800406 RepID=A0A9Q4C744_9CORY|nr:MFS transporter [Corynebacterium pygosceleis]MCK7637492.1 MFS transporter [Corynebacterium pygosceleis]MCK7674679.1 MFS transporter [Corynebacterium pygosceleis]MCL0119732.1 MFS transporter [Corynebacterium pygosceleis]MCX7468179.1 MFS transporter [Corynebacterium pygosceleis]
MSKTGERQRFPWWMLGFCIALFSLFTDDYIIAGILPDVAEGLDVSEAAAGQLVTVFSVTMAVGVAVFGVVFARVPRTLLLPVALVIFTVANALAVVTDSYWGLVVLRMMSALSAAACLPVFFAAAAELAPQRRQGRYLGLLSVSVTGAVAVGVPLGVWIGGTVGWHATFGFIAVCGAVSTLLVVLTFPGVEPAPAISVREQLKVLAHPSISVALIGGAVAVMGALALVTYLAPFLEATVGSATDRGTVFMLFGVAATAGVFGGGWCVDAIGPDRTIMWGMGGYAVLMAVFTTLTQIGPVPLPVILALTPLWGALAYWCASAVQVRLHQIAGPLTAQALALNSSLSAVGVAGGAAVGGLLIKLDAAALLSAFAGLGCLTGLCLLLIAFRKAESDPVTASTTA